MVGNREETALQSTVQVLSRPAFVKALMGLFNFDFLSQLFMLEIRIVRLGR